MDVFSAELFTDNGVFAKGFLDAVSDGIGVFEKKGDEFYYVFVNREAEKYFSSSIKVVGSSIEEVHDSMTSSFLRERLRRALKWKTMHWEEITSRNGLSFEGELTVHPILGQGKECHRLVIVVKNIQVFRKNNQLKENERLLKEVENRYRSLVEMSPDAVFVHNEQDEIIYLNNAGVRLVNAISKEDMLGQNIYRFIHADSASTIKERIKSIITTGIKSGPNTHCFHKVDGTPFFVEIHAARVEYDGKFAVQTICRDITERKKQQDQLRILAYRDQLTDIYNRRFFFSKMQEEVEHASKVDRGFAIVYLDFDNFKEINDTHGHFVGDETLIIITRRVNKILRKEDVFARIGGDEFVILLPGANHEQVKLVAQRILDQVLQPVIFNGESFHVTVSIGVSLFPLHSSDGQALISYADKALYQAKGSGKNCVCIYDPAKKYS